MQPENYRFLQEHIRRQSGIVLDDDNKELIETRLIPVAFDHGLATLDDLCNRLRLLSDISLQRKVVEAVTIGETSFFFEPADFEALRHYVVPALIQLRNAEQKLTFWSAAVSSGQEAYSLAMLICELELDAWDIRIIGTDLSSSALARASAGLYSGSELEQGLPIAFRRKYFIQRDEETWEVSPVLRRMTNFKLVDLRYQMRSLGQFDVVLCRNVLSYFERVTESRVLEDIHRVLHPGGYLFLGGCESQADMCARFIRVIFGDTRFYKSL